MFKREVGDRVKVLFERDRANSKWEGQEVVIKQLCPGGGDPHYTVENDSGEVWWFGDEELEDVYPKKMPFEIGDVILVTQAYSGFLKADVGKYVEVIGYGEYDGEPAVEVVAYDCVLESGTPGLDDGVVGLESFGDNPMILLNTKTVDQMRDTPTKELYSGGSSDYYKVFVKHPTTLDEPYEAECNDVIEALGMTFAEGNAFKAIWRKAKARQGVKKKGYDNGVYDSEKVVFFGERMLIQAKSDE